MLIKYFKNKSNKKKEEKIKKAYEYIRNEIETLINNILIECNNNIEKQRNFIFEHTICFEVFSYPKEQISSTFQATIKTYKDILIERQIVSKFGQYEWCNENII